MILRHITLHWKNRVYYFGLIFFLIVAICWADDSSARKLRYSENSNKNYFINEKPKAFILLYYSELRNEIITGDGKYLQSLMVEFNINYKDHSIKKILSNIAETSKSPIEFYDNLNSEYKKIIRHKNR